MFISKKWLQKYIPAITNWDSKVIADRLTQSLAEVESVKELGTNLDKLVVGEVISVEKHPDADKLHVCKVNIGNNVLQIVCGASNVTPNIRVVVCLAGGSVNASENGGRQPITETKIRGVQSQGMLCSERELGLSEDHSGIMILGDEFSVGTDFDDYLADTIFEIENKSLTHRGDCFSHLGIARELATILDLQFLKIDEPQVPVQTDSLAVEIRVQTDKCKQFTAITLKNIEVKPSPFWLKQALATIGIRSINNVVDATNYVMYDLGQPLHAYDYTHTIGNCLIVRESRAGEQFAAINHKTFELKEGSVVIADREQIQGLAGIMGSISTEINEKTTDIILEAAQFADDAVLNAQRQHGLYTDSGIRMSKGIDPLGVKRGLMTAAQLIQDLAGGEIGSEILDVSAKNYEQVTLDMDLQTINQLLGTSIAIEEMLIYLERLGIVINNREEINTSSNLINIPIIAKLSIPSWRDDLHIAADIAEEIGRVYGYDRIEPKLPERKYTSVGLSPELTLIRVLRKLALRLGFTEVMSYSFISEKLKQEFKLLDRQLLEVTNSISPELKYVRPSLIPSLTEVLAKNSSREDIVRIFEVGRVVDVYEYTDEKLPKQDWHLAMLHATKKPNSKADINGKKAYLEFKGDVHQLITSLGVGQVEWRDFAAQDNLFMEHSLHPYRRATLLLDGKPLAVFGELHPEIAQKYTGRAFVCEINLAILLSSGKIGKIAFEPISVYPKLTRDLSFWLKSGAKIGDMMQLIHNQATEGINIQQNIIDEYQEQDRQSITVNLELQAKDRTLTDTEANELIANIINALEKSGSEIR